MRIVLHRDIPDDPLLQSQWNALVQEMERPEVFYTHQWALAVQRAFGDSLLPMLALAYEEEKLTGVAALATDPAGKTVSFLCSTSADYCDFLSPPDRRADLLDTVLAELRRAGLANIVLTSLPAESATIKALRSAACRQGYHLLLRPTAVCAQVQLGSEEERVKLKTTLGKKKIFRYSMNALAREGPVSFHHLVTWKEIEPVLASFSVAHVARFLATGRISNVANEQRRTFLSELARLLSESGWLVLSRMMVGDRPVAWNYGFRFQGSWFWYQPTFDASYEKLSPGYCLLSKIISETCDNPEMRVIDLGLGAEGYKERFANNARTTLHASFTKSLEQHTRGAVRYYGARAVKLIPRAEPAARVVVEYIGRTRRAFHEGGIQGFVAQAGKRFVKVLGSRDEVVFYRGKDNQLGQSEAAPAGLSLKQVDLETLAAAAMLYENEGETLSYLLRSVRRLQLKTGQGFALLNRESTPLHFCWVDDFEAFEMKELRTRLSAATQNAAIIFDNWTPPPQRGHGYLGMALSLTAQRVSNSEKEPWTFSAIADEASRREIERAGFERRYSITRKKTLIWQWVSKVAFDGPAAKVEAQAG